MVTVARRQPDMSRQINQQTKLGQVLFRVWPDGTVQCRDDGEANPWMSDDYFLVWAYDEEEALALVTSAAVRRS